MPFENKAEQGNSSSSYLQVFKADSFKPEDDISRKHLLIESPSKLTVQQMALACHGLKQYGTTREKGKYDFNCYVFTASVLKDFLGQLATQLKSDSCPYPDGTRFQYLFKSTRSDSGHWFAADVRILNGKLEFFLLDAHNYAGEIQNHIEQDILAAYPDAKITLSVLPIQWDHFNCAWFALHHALTLAKTQNLHDLLGDMPHQQHHSEEYFNDANIKNIKFLCNHLPDSLGSVFKNTENHDPINSKYKRRDGSLLTAYFDKKPYPSYIEAKGDTTLTRIHAQKTKLKKRIVDQLKTLPDSELIKISSNLTADFYLESLKQISVTPKKNVPDNSQSETKDVPSSELVPSFSSEPGHGIADSPMPLHTEPAAELKVEDILSTTTDEPNKDSPAMNSGEFSEKDDSSEEKSASLVKVGDGLSPDCTITGVVSREAVFFSLDSSEESPEESPEPEELVLNNDLSSTSKLPATRSSNLCLSILCGVGVVLGATALIIAFAALNIATAGTTTGIALAIGGGITFFGSSLGLVVNHYCNKTMTASGELVCQPQ